jgi:hypothetical protein
VRRPTPALIVASFGLAISLGLPASTPASAPDDFYGVNAQALFAEPSSGWDTQLDAIDAGGLQLVRTDARWAVIEPRAPDGDMRSYAWSGPDAIVQALAEHGLRWYPVLEAAPGWAAQASGDISPAAARIPDFAYFGFALASRYGRGGSFWRLHPALPALPVIDYEIWNEENSAVFWPSQADAPERFADLFIAARQAIRAVDQQARVVIGGLALVNPPLVSDEVTFLERMVSHRPDLIGQVDGVGLHPYQATPADTYARIDRVRSAVNELLGPSVAIDVTEVGWSALAVPEPQRAAYLDALATDLPRSNCNVADLLPYAWVTPESDPSNPEDWFGIWSKDGSPRPSGQAFTQSALSMRGLSPSTPAAGGELDLCPTAHAAPTTPVARRTAPPGPRLRLRVEANKRRHRITVFARCPAGCKLALALMRRRGSKLTAVAHRSTRFSTRRSRVRLRYPRRARRLQLDVVATGANGGRTVRVREIPRPKRERVTQSG